MTEKKREVMRKKNEAVVAASYKLMDAYRAQAKAHIENGHDEFAASALEKCRKIHEVLRGRL
jgi:hypothetical protein